MFRNRFFKLVVLGKCTAYFGSILSRSAAKKIGGTAFFLGVPAQRFEPLFSAAVVLFSGTPRKCESGIWIGIGKYKVGMGMVWGLYRVV